MGVTVCFVCTHALMTVALVVSSERPRSSCACVGIEIFVFWPECLRSSMHVCFRTCARIECLGLSMHRLLYICMGVDTLVLFKCLGSSMRVCLHMRKDCDTRCID